MPLTNKGTLSERAANFPAASINIGNWQRISRHEGDITTKIYFAKRRFVYEVFEGNLKYKIEFNWSDISAIRAILLDNQPGTLEIELSHPPSYFREATPQPRKHTVWQKSDDFTGGQAPAWRRHTVSFKTGILNKHYERLMQFNERLFDMSQKPFPSHENPYFDPFMPFHINRPYGSICNLQGLQYPFQSFSAPECPLTLSSYPLLPVTNLPYANVGGNLNDDHLITHPPQPQPEPQPQPQPQTSYSSQIYDHNPQYQHQPLDFGHLKNLENFLLEEDQSNVPANVEMPMDSFLEPTDVINPVNSFENYSTTGYPQYPYAADQMLQDIQESAPITDWCYSQQPANWKVPPQQSSDNYVEAPQQYTYEGSSSHAPYFDPGNNPTGGGFF